MPETPTPESFESRESAAAAPRGRGIEALFAASEPFPLHDLAVAAQALAMSQLERIERPDGDDDVRCLGCHIAWAENGVPRRHLDFCMVGRALALADRALALGTSKQVPFVAAPKFSPIELKVWERPLVNDEPTDQILVPREPVMDHHTRTEVRAAASPFPSGEPGSRIVEVADCDELFGVAVQMCRGKGWVSISAIQREFNIAAGRAMRLVEQMKAAGFVGPRIPGHGYQFRELFTPTTHVDDPAESALTR